MDIKKRTKNIKLKLKELGYDVKHTHCKEILAVAHGFRNSHHLIGKSSLSETIDVLLPKDIYITTSVSPNTTNECYTEQIRGCKIHFNQTEINKLIESRDFIKDRDLSVNIHCGEITPFEGFDKGFFQEETKGNKCLQQKNYPLNSVDILDYLSDTEYYLSKDFYLEKNCFDFEGDYEAYIKASKYGISVVILISDKYQETAFSSYSIPWDKLELENKLK